MLYSFAYFLAPTTSFERKGFCTFRLKWGCSGTENVPQQPIFSRKLQNRFLSEGGVSKRGGDLRIQSRKTTEGESYYTLFNLAQSAEKLEFSIPRGIFV